MWTKLEQSLRTKLKRERERAMILSNSILCLLEHFLRTFSFSNKNLKSSFEPEDDFSGRF